MIAAMAALGLLVFLAVLFVLLAQARGLIRLQMIAAILAAAVLALTAVGAAYQAWSAMDAALALALAMPGVVLALAGRLRRMAPEVGVIAGEKADD